MLTIALFTSPLLKAIAKIRLLVIIGVLFAFVML